MTAKDFSRIPLFGTSLTAEDLATAADAMRRLHISHAKLGPVELWLDRVPDAPGSVLTVEPKAPPAVDPQDWTDEEASYLP